MNTLFPIIAAVLQAGSVTVDKLILSIRRVGFKTYVGISFPLIFFATLILFILFEPPLSRDLFSGNLVWFLLISIAFTIITNLFFYRALDHDKLSEIETLSLLDRIPVILFSSIIFTDERNVAVLIPALIAAGAIIWSHWERHHFTIRRKTLPYFLWSLAAAPAGAAISKILLRSWHPIALEFIRSGVVAIILGKLFTRHIRQVPPKASILFFLTNFLTTAAWILFYFSYQRSGIIYTILVFSLQPLLVYFASVFFLKERLQWKKALAFGIILLSIAAAQIIR